MGFREHDPADFITKVSPVSYDPKATAPRWTSFVDEVMQEKTAVGYFQKAVSYAMTGDTSLECLFIMYGPTTRSGKTTAIETILPSWVNTAFHPNRICLLQTISGVRPTALLPRM